MNENKPNESEYLPMIIEIEKEDEAMIRQLSELERCRLKSNVIISTYTATAAATGAIPLPVADGPLLVGQQVLMLLNISEAFGLNVRKHGLRSLVFTVLGTSGTTVLGKTITGSLFKLIPGIGTAAGALITGGTAAALTAALGKAYQQLCEAVFIGDLDEADLLTEKGRLMLTTAFKNNVRLEMKSSNEDEKDVLQETKIPCDDQVIAMNFSGSTADGAEEPSQETSEK